MTFTVIIFILSIVSAFYMLLLKAYKIRRTHNISLENKIPVFPFRHLEKIMLYFIKYIIQTFVFIFIKYWFIIIAKIKKWFIDKWPKINSYFKKKPDLNKPYRHSFFQKAILESKAKIKSIKEKVDKEIN